MTRLCVFCTGITGSGTADYLKRVEKTNPVFDIGRMMFEIAEKNLGAPIPRTKILDKSDSELAPLRAAAFEKILRETRDLDKPFFVRSHGSFRWKGSLRKAFDLHYLSELKPDIFISIVDSIPEIYHRVHTNNQWKGKLDLKEIVVWRDEEAVLTELMANYQSKPFYLLPFEEPLETLFGIIAGKKRAYLSYPITHMSRNEWFEEKNGQRDLLRRKLVIFDPSDIRDVEFVSKAAEAKREGKKMVEYQLRSGKIIMTCDEILQIENDIKFQTVQRDFKIIDQCHMVIALYPQAVKSQGVADEVKYGSTHKDVFLISPLKGIDPFTDFNITARYQTVEDFLRNFESSS